MLARVLAKTKQIVIHRMIWNENMFLNLWAYNSHLRICTNINHNQVANKQPLFKIHYDLCASRSICKKLHQMSRCLTRQQCMSREKSACIAKWFNMQMYVFSMIYSLSQPYLLLCVLAMHAASLCLIFCLQRWWLVQYESKGRVEMTYIKTHSLYF